MAPPRLYELPNEQLVRLLREARGRALSFDEAWEEAMRPDKSIVMSTSRGAPAGAVRWPTDRSDREAWRWALVSSKEGWRRAYEMQPMTPQERAISELAGALQALDDTAGVMARSEGIPRLQAVA